MTNPKKVLQFTFTVLTLVSALAFNTSSVLAAAPEESFPNNTVKLTVCNYKFNFTTYFNNTVNLLNGTPYDKYDPNGGTRYCYVQDNFTCTNGATLGTDPVVGLFNNTVNGVTYPAQGDVTTGSGVNYCLNESVPTIFKAIAPNNNVNLIPKIYDVTNKTGATGETYYEPGKWDNVLCKRGTDGVVSMKDEYTQYYNHPNQAIRDAFRSQLGSRDCSVTPINREIYQFKYTIAYPSNDVCNAFYDNLKPKVIQYYEANNNGAEIRTLYKSLTGKKDAEFTAADLTSFYNYFKAYNSATAKAFGTGTGQVNCPAFYKSSLGSKFNLDSNEGVVVADTYHLMLNESYTAYIGWRKVESGTRLNDQDQMKKSWDGYTVFNLKTAPTAVPVTPVTPTPTPTPTDPNTGGGSGTGSSTATTSCANGSCKVTINNVCKVIPNSTSVNVETVNGVTTVNGKDFASYSNC